MDESTAGAPGGVGATPSRLVGAVLWALVCNALAVAGLAVLTCALLVVHVLVYGMASVFAPEAGLAAPGSGRYVLAFAVGVIVHVVTASALTLLVSRTALRTWPVPARGLGTALVAAAAAGCALLLMLGISPVGFLLAL